VLAVAQAEDFLLEQALRLRLALDARQVCSSLAVQKHQVEDEEHELVGLAIVHSGLQAAENRDAVGVEGAELAVEIGGPDLELAEPFDRHLVAMGPVQACPGQQLRPTTVDPRVHAAAVVLDLVHPVVARRRLVHQARELWLDPLRRPRCRSHGGD
jgi:hypothetical protein